MHSRIFKVNTEYLTEEYKKYIPIEESDYYDNGFLDGYHDYVAELSKEEEILLSQKIDKLRKTKKKHNSIEKIRKHFKLLTKEILLENKPENLNGSLFMALDYPHAHKNKVFSNKEIFPLQKIQFENIELYAPNNSETVLEKEFGDYMKIPKNSYPRHSNYANIAKDERKVLEELAKC